MSLPLPPSSGVKPVFAAEARTRVTNGRALLPGVDGRSYWVRRVRDLVALHISDLGGEANCSEAEKSIVRRAAVLTIEMERLERHFALADPGQICHAELDLYCRLANSVRRLLDMAGLERRPRDVTPTIDQYLDAEPAK